MMGSAGGPQLWNMDIPSTNEHWLPIEMEITNEDIDTINDTNDNGWGVPLKLSAEM